MPFGASHRVGWPVIAEQFGREAVELVRSGRSIRDVVESLGVLQHTLRNWAKQVAINRRERHRALVLPRRFHIEPDRAARTQAWPADPLQPALTHAAFGDERTAIDL